MFLPVATLIIGAVLSFVADSIRNARERRQRERDGLRVRQAEAAAAFLDEAYKAAHRLGRMAPGCPSPLAFDDDAYWVVESEVSRRLMLLELVASSRVVSQARGLRDALRPFREAVRSGVTYDSEAYWAAYKPVQQGRQGFLHAIREDMGVDEHQRTLAASNG